MNLTIKLFIFIILKNNYYNNINYYLLINKINLNVII